MARNSRRLTIVSDLDEDEHLGRAYDDYLIEKVRLAAEALNDVLMESHVGADIEWLVGQASSGDANRKVVRVHLSRERVIERVTDLVVAI